MSHFEYNGPSNFANEASAHQTSFLANNFHTSPALNPYTYAQYSTNPYDTYGSVISANSLDLNQASQSLSTDFNYVNSIDNSNNNSNRYSAYVHASISEEPSIDDHLKSYYDHRYSSYEPFDYLSYLSNAVSQNAASLESKTYNHAKNDNHHHHHNQHKHNHQQQQQQQQTTSSTMASVNRRPIKIRNMASLENDSTRQTEKVDENEAAFKTFKERFDPNSVSSNRPATNGSRDLNNRHSINIDDLTRGKQHSKDVKHKTVKHSNPAQFGVDSTNALNKEKRTKSIHSLNESAANQKESALFQKIMAKLAQVPDSVLLNISARQNDQVSHSSNSHRPEESSSSLRKPETRSSDSSQFKSSSLYQKNAARRSLKGENLLETNNLSQIKELKEILSEEKFKLSSIREQVKPKVTPNLDSNSPNKKEAKQQIQTSSPLKADVKPIKSPIKIAEILTTNLRKEDLTSNSANQATSDEKAQECLACKTNNLRPGAETTLINAKPILNNQEKIDTNNNDKSMNATKPTEAKTTAKIIFTIPQAKATLLDSLKPNFQSTNLNGTSANKKDALASDSILPTSQEKVFTTPAPNRLATLNETSSDSKSLNRPQLNEPKSSLIATARHKSSLSSEKKKEKKNELINENTKTSANEKQFNLNNKTEFEAENKNSRIERSSNSSNHYEEIEETANFDDSSSLSSLEDHYWKKLEINETATSEYSKIVGSSQVTAKVLSNYPLRLFDETNIFTNSQEANDSKKKQAKKNEQTSANKSENVQNNEENRENLSPVMRVLKTTAPPPLPPVIEAQKSQNPKTTNAKSSKSSNSDSNSGKEGSSNRPLSITSTIREGRTEKPIRSVHAIPPPPPPPQKKVLIAKNTNQNNNPEIVDAKEKQKASKIDELLKNHFLKSNNPQETTNHLNNAHKLIEQKPDKTRPHRIEQELEERIREQQKQLLLKQNQKHEQNLLIKVSKDEKPLILTNLPQLDKIDYIFKTKDEKYLTSGVPVLDEKRQQKSKAGKEKKPKQKVKDSVKEDSPLPLDLREAKNFYEVYSKENDRRKKEGNNFLMLLPGIAIPLDESENADSDDSSS